MGNSEKELSKGFVGDEAVTAFFPKVIKDDSGNFYSTSENTYGYTFDAATTNEAKEHSITYTADPTIKGFLEGENASYAFNARNSTYSNGDYGNVAGRNAATVVENLPAGKYTFKTYVVSNGNRAVVLRDLNNGNVDSNTLAAPSIGRNETGEKTASFNLYGTRTVGVTGYTTSGRTNQSADFDYAMIVRTGDVTEVTGITISGNKTTVQEGSTLSLTATLTPDNPTESGVTWTSSDTSIATVSDNGTVTGVATGTVTITATAKGGNNVSATYTISVTGNNSVNNLTPIDEDYTFIPSYAFVDDLLYEGGKLIAKGADKFNNLGIVVKNSGRYLAFKVKNKQATIKVTYYQNGDNKKDDHDVEIPREGYIGITPGGFDLAHEVIGGKGQEKTITATSSVEQVIYVSANDQDLYVKKIQVIYNKYTVTYNVANGSLAVGARNPDQEDTPAAGVTLPKVTPENGYSFVGWSTNPAANTADAGVADETYYPTSNITLYAVCIATQTLQSVTVNGHTLVADNGNTYSYTIGTAWGKSTIPVTITPAPTAKATVGGKTSSSNGQAITVDVPINGESQAISVSSGSGSPSTYYIKVNSAPDLTVSNDAYALQNQTYYEGQRFVSPVGSGSHITAWISTTAGGNNLNTAGSNYGELLYVADSYSGDIAYSYRLSNAYGNGPTFISETGVPTAGTYYAFQPTVDGVLEVAVNINADKTLYVVSDDSKLTCGSSLATAGYIVRDITLSNGATTAAATGSILINVEADKTYYVYAAGTKLGLLGFALNQYLYVTSGSQTFILSEENLAKYAYFTKENATTTRSDYGDVTISRVKNTSDKVIVKVKGAKAVAGVVYNSGGNGRKFSMGINGTAQTAETAAGGVTTSSYYAISENGATASIVGAGSDVYAYELLFSQTMPSVITIKKNNVAVTSDELFKRHTATYTVTTTNNSSTIDFDDTGVSGIATVTLSNGTLTIKPTTEGSGYIKLSQDAAGDYDAGERLFFLTVKKHKLLLTMKHGGNQAYTKATVGETTTYTGSYYSAVATEDGGTTTAWTITTQMDTLVVNTYNKKQKYPVNEELTYKYYSDDKSIATVTENGGAVSLVQGGNGTANITVYFAGNDTLSAAKAQYTITVSSGYNVKIPSSPAPKINEKFAAVNGSDTLCTMITCGYKYNDGIIFNKKDEWDGPSAYEDENGYSCQIDGFVIQSQAEQDSRNEYNKKVAWMADNIADTVYRQRVEPFTLPVRGAYLKFEPTVNGVLTAYVLQNGDISMDNHRPKNIGGLPRIYYWFDQDGFRIPPTSVTSKLPLCYGRDYTDENGTEVFNNQNDYPKNCLSYWYTMYSDLQASFEDTTNPMWPTQAQVEANLAKVMPDPQPVVRLDSGYCVHQKAYVKYVLNVVAGNTYYFFSNNSKVGVVGYNFQPANSSTITCKAFDNSGTVHNLTVTRTEESQTLDQAVTAVTSLKPNSDYAINQYDQITFDRTFKVDTWNSITLPFPLTETQVEKVFGVGTKLMLYNGLEGTTAHFIRHVDQNILAGQPYFIKPTGKDWTGKNLSTVSDSDSDSKVGGKGVLTFKGVNVSFTLAENTNYGSNRYKSDLYNEPSASYVAVGTLMKTTVNNGDYYISPNDGKLYELNATSGSSELYAYRAYLKQNSANAAKISSVNYLGLDGVEWDWEEEVTGIMEVLVNDMGVEIAPVNGVYNLNGQKVGDSTKGLPAGLYIVNGKVINIK